MLRIGRDGKLVENLDKKKIAAYFGTLVQIISSDNYLLDKITEGGAILHLKSKNI